MSISVLAIGDSNTKRSAPTVPATWPSRLYPEWSVNNQAVIGSLMVTWWDPDAGGGLYDTHVAPYLPVDCVAIRIGHVDANQDIDRTDYRRALAGMLAQMPGQYVALMTLSQEWNDPAQDRQNARLVEYREEAIRAYDEWISAGESGVLVDTFLLTNGWVEYSEEDPYGIRSHLRDPVHINARGHQIEADAVSYSLLEIAPEIVMLTVQDAYDRLEISQTVGDDAADDAWVQRQIDGVTLAIRNYTRRRITATAYDDTYTNPSVVFARDMPIAAGPLTVTADDAVMVDGTDYRVHPETGQLLRLADGTVRADGSWYDTTDLLFQYSAGYLATPEDILQVFDWVIGKRWNKRAAGSTVLGAIGTGEIVKKVTMADVGSVEYSQESGAALGSDSEVAGDWLAGFPLSALDHYVRISAEIEDAAPYTHMESAVV